MIKQGEKYQISTNKVDQWTDTKVVSEVEVVETPKPRARKVLCYIEPCRGNYFVPIKELKEITLPAKD